MWQNHASQKYKSTNNSVWVATPPKPFFSFIKTVLFSVYSPPSGPHIKFSTFVVPGPVVLGQNASIALFSLCEGA